MSAPERIPPRSVTAADLLAHGELTVRGRIREASNAVLLCTAERDGERTQCVYKPVAGERPLWDFPEGSLARREVAAFEVSRALGWDLVPETVLRDGPHGEGMCQLWIDTLPQDEAPELLALVDAEEPEPGWKAIGLARVAADRTALLVHADDARLRRMAVLDAVINNADRKGGHLLPAAAQRLYGIDHGVTFHTDDKLRTLLWGWAGEPLTEEACGALAVLHDDLADGAPLALRLAELITPAELTATRERVRALRDGGVHPVPSGEWPAIPWPPV